MSLIGFLAALAVCVALVGLILWYLGRCNHHFTKVDGGVIHEYFLGDWLRDRHWSLHQCSRCGKYKKCQQVVG